MTFPASFVASSSLIVVWVAAIVLTQSIEEQERWHIPGWLKSTLSLQLAPVLFYVLLALTVGFYIAVPLFFVSGRASALLVTICALPGIAIVFLITYVGKYRAATQTKAGKATFVTIFIPLTLVAIPLDLLLFWLVMN